MDKKKIIIIISVALLVLIGVVIALRIRYSKAVPELDQQPDTLIDPNATVEETSEDETTEEVQANQNVGYSVTINPSSSWEENGKYVTQFDVVLTNDSTASISDWKLTFDNVADGDIVNAWNGKVSISGGAMTVTPEDYNGTVNAGDKVECGVQVAFTDGEAAGKVSKNGVLYVGGEKVDVLASANETATEQSTENETTAEETEEEKPKKEVKAESGTAYDNHGALSVKGTDLVDKNGEKYQLKGVSTHGLSWFPDYVNKDAFATFRDDWGANIVRLAMYTDEGGGYCTDGDKAKLKALVKSGIDEATELGMYVIVDWHILHDLTPLKYEDEAKKFFEEISSEYKNSDNIIYEICNEPNGGTEWPDIKKYAEDIIPIIKKNDSNAVIVVGTPNWSQDVDIAAKDPIKGYDNIMYTLHFYAATHKDDLRGKLTTAKNAGLPIFITEFSICEASGNGTVDYDSAKAWFKLINDNNLSYCAWNVSNKDEKSSLIKSNVSKKSGWTEDDLSETGVWIRQQMK